VEKLIMSTKQALIDKVYKSQDDLNRRDVELIISNLIDKMATKLADENRIEIRGFGSFTIRSRASRYVQNPNTKSMMKIPPKKVIYFRMGKPFVEKLNPALS
jgi:integration host factor subunit beta